MVEIRSFLVENDDTQQALSALDAELDAGAIRASLLYLFYGVGHDDAAIYRFLKARFGDVPIIGGTSCNGAMTDAGLGGPGTIGLLAIDDPDGDYGSATARLDGDVESAAEQALLDALDSAGCVGELPEMIWIYQAPGHEERVISGLRRVVGDRCPIIGGSSADNDVTGKWRQMGPDGPVCDSLVVGVMFSSGSIGYAFQGGYEPSGNSGVVTEIGFDRTTASGVATRTAGRKLLTIDGRPAAEVYNEWVDGLLGDRLDEGGNILADTTMHPVGVAAGAMDGIENYLLIHPEKILPGGGLSTFAEVAEGAKLFGMLGSRKHLISRAGKTVEAATTMLPAGKDELAGGVVVYCGGCMLAVGDEMPKVAETVRESFAGTPFIGCFTYGEQGTLLGRNAHGNLMISAIVFSR